MKCREDGAYILVAVHVRYGWGGGGGVETIEFNKYFYLNTNYLSQFQSTT